MSSVNASTTQSSSPEKKVRAPALSEKYSKFIQFSYYMMSQMSETETFTKEEFLNQVQMFATVDEQQTFIQGFFDNQKDNKKAMRKDIQERKKASQPKKVRAPRKTKKETTPTPTTDTQPVADNTNESQENLIENLTNELTEEPMISTTTTTTTTTTTNEVEVAEEPPMIDKINAAIEVAEDMTSKKPRAKKATTGEKKPRVAKKKQTKEPPPPKLTEADDSP
jgi:hypothetical protein